MHQQIADISCFYTHKTEHCAVFHLVFCKCKKGYHLCLASFSTNTRHLLFLSSKRQSDMFVNRCVPTARRSAKAWPMYSTLSGCACLTTTRCRSSYQVLSLPSTSKTSSNTQTTPVRCKSSRSWLLIRKYINSSDQTLIFSHFGN